MSPPGPLQHLLTVDLGFEVTVTGFEVPETASGNHLDLSFVMCSGVSGIWLERSEFERPRIRTLDRRKIYREFEGLH
jgi:hypothetical protein